jgi:hypothetical protein
MAVVNTMLLPAREARAGGALEKRMEKQNKTFVAVGALHALCLQTDAANTPRRLPSLPSPFSPSS